MNSTTPNSVAKMPTISQEEFMQRARKAWGDKYDLSRAVYRSYRDKIIIGCPEHGFVEIGAGVFMHGYRGCPECGRQASYLLLKNRVRTQGEFLEKMRAVHGDKYDFSKSVYVKYNHKVEVICPKHGVFFATPSSLTQGSGCPQCAKELISKQKKYTRDRFVKLATEKHNGFYDYSLVEYKTHNDKVQIICPKHGPFWQVASRHLLGVGCKKCGRDKCADKTAMSQEEFIERATEIHGGKYDYSLVKYKNTRTRVTIVCPKHGPFKQTPFSHLQGQGCPDCRISFGEEAIGKYLEKRGVAFVREKKFKECAIKRPLKFDFFLPEKNACIEYQGVQHYKPVKFFGGVKDFKARCERDQAKRDFCKKNNIRLLEIRYDENVEEKLNKLLV